MLPRRCAANAPLKALAGRHGPLQRLYPDLARFLIRLRASLLISEVRRARRLNRLGHLALVADHLLRLSASTQCIVPIRCAVRVRVTGEVVRVHHLVLERVLVTSSLLH